MPKFVELKTKLVQKLHEETNAKMLSRKHKLSLKEKK